MKALRLIVELKELDAAFEFVGNFYTGEPELRGEGVEAIKVQEGFCPGLAGRKCDITVWSDAIQIDYDVDGEPRSTYIPNCPVTLTQVRVY